MTSNARLSLVLVIAAAVFVLLAATLGGGGSDESVVANPSDLVRSDSLRISDAPAGAVEFVEFLDFECEACRAAHPAVTELRERYGDRVAFVVRHFPLHNNSDGAALAAEAAADQGAFTEMMDLLFETQPEWGEKSTSQREVFFGFAEVLGLDMDRFGAVYDDPATLEKIYRDMADGMAAGVEGTPTFFLGGDKLRPSSFEDLVNSIEEAIG